MNENEMLQVTEVETFTFDQPGVVGAETFTFDLGAAIVSETDPIIAQAQEELLLPPVPEPVPMCWATDGGASFDVNAFDFYYSLLGDQLFEIFHLVPYDAALYG